ncbi:MAG: sigma-54 dependent transcriptional regulator [Pseudomonadales bacterium]|nr:sigma-54 dependent transcriptional regulator [Pseudomonadales bacterium]NRA14024.1 sigma-54-dependent Fis family transcriptional regulator [Oceanospirillaceae bacterium]
MTQKKMTFVLLIEDDPTLMSIYKAYLSALPYQLSLAETGERALKILASEHIDLILLDIQLPDMTGLDILKHLQQCQHPADVIVTTSDCSMNTAIEAMKLGARDYLLKPFDKDRLITTLKNTSDSQKLKQIVDIYQDKIDRSQFCGFIGSSLAMQQVYQLIDSAASSKATIFITGDSGTGKEVCAEAAHQRSNRSDQPFIALNCAAIPSELIESEIFGHVKGAFTGALASRDGLAKAADGGTLFLDEICEMELSLQSKLLRFLQTGTLQKVGSDTTEKVDVRIICATNKDPLTEIERGNFREDLFYRLHVLPIHLPPLRDRESDVIEIARHFLAQYTREEQKDFSDFEPQTEYILSQYHWPGNIRQLQNVIRNIVVLCNAQTVSAEMLPAPLDKFLLEVDPNIGRLKRVEENTVQQQVSPSGPKADNSRLSTNLAEQIQPLSILEREAIEHAILLCQGNVPKAAHYLGISAATVYRKRNSWR